MSPQSGTTPYPRLIGAANLALGIVLVTRPDSVASAVADGSVPNAGVVRLLGGRYLLQGSAQLARPGVAVLGTSVVVDGLHAASMFGLAAYRADYRRPALLSAVAATVAATVTALAARHLRRSSR
jgi:hypothetical protein